MKLANGNKKIILMIYSNASKDMKLIRSIASTGGGFFGEKENIIVGIQGARTGNHTMIPVKFKDENILKELEVKAATTQSIQGLTNDENDLKNLKTPRGRQASFETFKSFPFVILPPMLWTKLIDLKLKSPFKVLKTVLESIESFKNKNENKEG